MRLKREFISHKAGEESMLVPTGTAGWAGIVRGNSTFGTILDLLAEETTEDEVVASMRQRYDAPEGIIERDVRHAIAELERIGALE